MFFFRPYHDCLRYRSLFHVAVWQSFLNADNNDIAKSSVLSMGATHNLYTLNLFGTRIVCNLEHAPQLNHQSPRVAFSKTSSTIHLFSLLIFLISRRPPVSPLFPFSPFSR